MAIAQGTSNKQLRIRLDGLPYGTNVAHLYEYFKKFGSVTYVHIDNRGNGRGSLTFCPPPKNDVRSTHSIRVKDKFHDVHIVPHQISMKHSDSTINMLNPTEMSIGVLTGQSQMMKLRTINGSPNAPLKLELHTQELVINFTLNSKHYTVRSNISHIASVHRSRGVGDCRHITFTFLYPLKVLSSQEANPSFLKGLSSWSKEKSMARVTDINKDILKLNRSPLSSCKTSTNAIDIGKWLTYSFKLYYSETNQVILHKISNHLNAHNIALQQQELNFTTAIPLSVWRKFNSDKHVTSNSTVWKASATLMHDQASGLPVLDFDLRYRIEVCLSNNLIFEGSITAEFLNKLESVTKRQALDLLDNLATSGKLLYNPMDLFSMPELKTRRHHKIPTSCVMMHSVTITPTTIYVNPVQVEVSNRVIRKYNEISDRFLRVRFTDEVYWGRLHNQNDNNGAAVYDRVRRAMVHGIRLGGRHYSFLACGNSQFREHGAYFLAPTSNVTVNDIRQWMGYFTHIREIPKYVARIGQCFSTTRAVNSIGLQPQILEIDDIVRNGYNFTDGVGKISKFLAAMVSQELHLGKHPPSVFQFRMGGCKGILAVDPTILGSRTVCIRPSQKKFNTDYNQLEIIRTSAFATAYLNKQIILVLSALGIADDVFVSKIKNQLASINQAMKDNALAITMLQQNVDFNQTTLLISKAIQNGLRGDSFVDSMLHLWRAWILKFLKEKTNLFIPQGAFLLGCIDETNTLQMNDDESGDGGLPEIFLQVPDMKQRGSYKVITGRCILARNPSLHPGDVRIVQAVECPSLNHLRDVVVFAQNGKRDLPNMCSGGDLDGDDFLIIWDPDLIPKGNNHAPMDYAAPAPILSHGPVTQSDMIQFFCDYMQNDSIGVIAIAHRAWADSLRAGVMDPKCLQLAHLHSAAVDYCKTGVVAQMSPDLRVDVYPHWMQRKTKQYHSKRILGQLFDQVEHVRYIRDEAIKFDDRIVDAYKHSDDLLGALREIKEDYDEDIRRVMTQFGIRDELQVVSAFVMSHNRDLQEYKLAEQLGQIITSIKNHFRDVCLGLVNLRTDAYNSDGRKQLAAAMYKITSEQRQRHGLEEERFISFPWIFINELCTIVTLINEGRFNANVNQIVMAVRDELPTTIDEEITDNHQSPVEGGESVIVKADTGNDNDISDNVYTDLFSWD